MAGRAHFFPFSFSSASFSFFLIVLLFYASPAAAFGAGNIGKDLQDPNIAETLLREYRSFDFENRGA